MATLKHVSSSTLNPGVAMPDFKALYAQARKHAEAARRAPPPGAFTEKEFAKSTGRTTASARRSISTLVRAGKVDRAGTFDVNGMRHTYFVVKQ